MVNKWEGLVHVLERDYKENISDMMKIGILIHMMPKELQDSIFQDADSGTQTQWTLATMATTRRNVTTTIWRKRLVL